MRVRASVSFCLVLGLSSLSATQAFAGFALVSSGFGTDRKSFVAPIDESKQPAYSAAIDPESFVHETTVDGPWVTLTALAELGVSPAPGVLYATGTAPGAFGSTSNLYAITTTKNAAGADVSIATFKQLVDLGEPMAVIEGAAFNHLGQLFLLVNAPDGRVVYRFDVVGTGWATTPSFTWKLPATASLQGSGGDLTALTDGRMFIALNEGDAAKKPRYFTVCREKPPVEIVRDPPSAAGYCADGVVAVQQVLAVDAGLDQHTVTPPNAKTEQTPAPFWPHATASQPFGGADLAGIVPFLDTDGDGLSDAEENACDNVRSVLGAGPLDYQDADIDDDCLNDKIDVLGGATPEAARQKTEIPNANTDRNCRGSAASDGADDNSICVLKTGDTNPTCTPGCRVGVAGSGCPGELVCVAPAGATVGTCQTPEPPAAGAGGVAGSAGRGNVGIDGQAGGAGGAPAGSGVGAAKNDDDGSCALAVGPRAMERTGLGALAVLGLGLLGLARRRGNRRLDRLTSSPPTTPGAGRRRSRGTCRTAGCPRRRCERR